MSQKCIVCNKKPVSGNTVSHSHRTSKRKFKPNLQKINIVHEGRKQKQLVCTSCIKAGKITTEADTMFNEILRNLERISDHADSLGISVMRG